MQAQFETVLLQALTLPAPDKARLIERLAATLYGIEPSDHRDQGESQEVIPDDWHAFIEQTAGSLAHDPLQRWPEGDFELRDAID